MSTDDLEELDLISAIWILASNNENHLITFEGIRERLGLGAQTDVRALVLKRRELFRPGGPPDELKEWQEAMRAGRRLPTWIKLIADPVKRQRAIEDLSERDVFRSQFRVGKGAPVSQIEVVTWGLEHLDRIRKGRIASREASAKSWQMWLVFEVAAANIIISLITLLKR